MWIGSYENVKMKDEKQICKPALLRNRRHRPKERTFIASESSSRQCMQRAQASFGAKTRRVSA